MHIDSAREVVYNSGGRYSLWLTFLCSPSFLGKAGHPPALHR